MQRGPVLVDARASKRLAFVVLIWLLPAYAADVGKVSADEGKVSAADEGKVSEGKMSGTFFFQGARKGVRSWKRCQLEKSCKRLAGAERSSAIQVKWHDGGCRKTQSFALRHPRLQLRDDVLGDGNLRVASAGQQARVELHADVAFTKHEEAQEGS